MIDVAAAAAAAVADFSSASPSARVRKGRTGTPVGSDSLWRDDLNFKSSFFFFSYLHSCISHRSKLAHKR